MKTALLACLVLSGCVTAAPLSSAPPSTNAPQVAANAQPTPDGFAVTGTTAGPKVIRQPCPPLNRKAGSTARDDQVEIGVAASLDFLRPSDPALYVGYHCE